MQKFAYTPECLLRDGKPWFPIMGEFHYSRFKKEYWAESLYKMKAGGVDVVSAYVIWLHHEEVEGEYDFGGQRDLRSFVRQVADCGLYFFIRIGPWCHGETRRGGLPDWMHQKGFVPRTNDEGYFAEVRRWYEEIYRQVDGLLVHQGGPIIGVQIENEYGHCGGLTGEEGEAHMRRLTAMAREVGFDLPLTTATGWGGAVTAGLLPVMGGYCDSPWDVRTTEIEPSGNYVFTHERNDHNIGSDFGMHHNITFDPALYPYLTAELGGGLQVTAHRRPVATARDIAAMSLVKLGSGVALLGYYMYHGGTNPKGKRTTLQESKAVGDLNDLPVLSYDFRCAVREYGQVSDTLLELKLLDVFAREFEEELCGMPAHIPPENPLAPADTTGLRWSTRHNGQSGFVFVNNYVRLQRMAQHDGVQLRVPLPGGEVVYPPIDVMDGDFYHFPFNLPVRGGVLKTALASPYCRLNRGTAEETLVLYKQGGPAKVEMEGAPQDAVLLLERHEALHAWKVRLAGREHVIVSENPVLESAKGLQVIGERAKRMKVYPKPEGGFAGYERCADEGVFAVYEKAGMPPEATASAELMHTEGDMAEWRLMLDVPAGVHECLLDIQYDAVRAELWQDGEMVADDFYAGTGWEVGLRHFGFAGELTLKTYALHPGEAIYLEHWPQFSGESVNRVTGLWPRVQFCEELVYRQ